MNATGTAGGFFLGMTVNGDPDGLTACRDARQYRENQRLTPSINTPEESVW
nr:hypothetical protein [Enterobacter cloacae]